MGLSRLGAASGYVTAERGYLHYLAASGASREHGTALPVVDVESLLGEPLGDLQTEDALPARDS